MQLICVAASSERELRDSARGKGQTNFAFPALPCSFLATTMDYELETPTLSSVESCFYAWARSRGAVISSKVGLRDFGSMGRGAVALEDIAVSPSYPLRKETG